MPAGQDFLRIMALKLYALLIILKKFKIDFSA